jgi:hypothetical protein
MPLVRIRVIQASSSTPLFSWGNGARGFDLSHQHQHIRQPPEGNRHPGLGVTVRQEKPRTIAALTAALPVTRPTLTACRNHKRRTI